MCKKLELDFVPKKILVHNNNKLRQWAKEEKNWVILRIYRYGNI
jgi:hypothetical protein